jgi:hypothetical protein
VTYKVDRLSRSLLDFAKMMETFDRHQVSFVSVTQQFNTAQSMGRLVLNVLLSFAQFEREIKTACNSPLCVGSISSQTGLSVGGSWMKNSGRRLVARLITGHFATSSTT